MNNEKAQKVIDVFMRNNYLVSPEIMYFINDDFDIDSFFSYAKECLKPIDTPVFVDVDLIKHFLKTKPAVGGNVKIVKSYRKPPIKKEVSTFVNYFKVRYETLKNFLLEHSELSEAISINKAKVKNEKCAVIGLVRDKKYTKSGNYIVTIEDLSGEINVIVRMSNPELVEKCKCVVYDEVIGVVGFCANEVMYAHDLFFPDMPMQELKKCEDDVYAAFIADLHIGSSLFLEKDFENFIKWLNCELGDENQKNLAKKVNYLFIVGDVVDGVGVYPGQEEELLIKDIKEQYKLFVKYVSMIRQDIKIIICPGNHDAVRLSEPQPLLDKWFVKELYEMKNVVLVSNPAVVNIHASENFSGFNVLLYHGYSFFYYFTEVEHINSLGLAPEDRTCHVMKLLLQKRHVAPTYGSTLYIADEKEDPLVIEQVPDVFVGAHVHKAGISNYKNVSIIACSCWQGKTSLQEKNGITPEPSRVVLMNLKTRKVKVLKFGE